jgi:hypothetical protein
MEALNEDSLVTFVTVEDISKSLLVEPVKSLAHDLIVNRIETYGVTKGEDHKKIINAKGT